LEAIANLDEVATPSAPSMTAPPIATTAVTAPSADSIGERRHVAVMFCDLVDSTGIAARLDAEEWRDLVGAYVDTASTAITEMGGRVAKKLGDGLMALFGYPVAQENDAERAVRAGSRSSAPWLSGTARTRARARLCLLRASRST
jgi:class 3 adenylate cyclase